MATDHSHPDLAGYTEMAHMTQSQLVENLRGLLGARLVAYLGNVKDTRVVRQWAEGTRSIGNDVDLERLRVAYRIARIITQRDTSEVAQAWFQGRNPVLDDHAPAFLLREGDISMVGPEVLAAAQQFVAVG